MIIGLKHKEWAPEVTVGVACTADAELDYCVARCWTNSSLLTAITAGAIGKPVARVAVGYQLDRQHIVCFYHHLMNHEHIKSKKKTDRYVA